MEISQKGIDISVWQGDYNLAQAKEEGRTFVIMKAGGRDENGTLFTDRCFEDNYRKALSLAMPCGCYWYTRAKDRETVLQEAEYLVSRCLQGKKFALPIYLDIEDKGMLSLGKDTLTSLIDTWCRALEKKGYFVGFYASLSYCETYIHDDQLQRYAHWIAQWAKECTYPNRDILGMWQYGGAVNYLDATTVAGQITDQDMMLIDYPSIIEKAGKNGFSEKPTSPSIPDFPLKVGDKVRIKESATVYGTDRRFAAWVYQSDLYLRYLRDDRAVISIYPKGAITGAVKATELEKR